VGNGDMLHYSPTSQFWISNRIAQACYKMYNQMAPTVRCAIDAFEQEQMMGAVPSLDEKVAKLVSRGRLRKARKLMTKYTVGTAQAQFDKWVKLEELLLLKYLDGNIKAQNEDGSFVCSEYHSGTPKGIKNVPYVEAWRKAVAESEHGKVLEVR
ncbi:MAG: hypothetical protein IJQ22_00880, partial [Bacteroidales bacterium]|nr:hypothetical protein [Bacteroidales bacterium]